MNSSWVRSQFLAYDTVPIAYYRCFPKVSPKAVCIIIHGVGEHAARYRPIAEVLAEVGVCSYLIDLRGFGSSGGARGCWNKPDDYFKDLSALHSLISSESKGQLPIYFLGHSFGGLIAACFTAIYAPKVNCQGLILSSPFFELAYKPPFWKSCFAKIAALFFPSVTQDTQIKPETLTHDSEIIRNYKKDTLNHSRMSAGFYMNMFGLLKKVDSMADNLTMPLLVLQAAQDQIASNQKIADFFARVKSSDKKLVVFKNDFHEIFNEIDRQDAFLIVRNWFESHLAI